MSNEFVGHPLLDTKSESKIDINQLFEKNKALISVFPKQSFRDKPFNAYIDRFYKTNEQ